MKKLLVLVSFLGLAACGDNLQSLVPDARELTDGGPMPDSPPGTPDGMPDSAPTSTVTVAPGACPGTPDHTLQAVAGMNWTFDGGADTQDLDITIAAGENIEFSTTGQHNFASVAATGALSFTSGAAVGGGHTACLTFTAAGGPADFHCETHPTVMTGTITVTP
jgi:hypothetical protein